MATMKAVIKSGRPEAVGALLDTMSESEAIEQLTNTYGGGNVAPTEDTSRADEDGLWRGTSPILHAAGTGQTWMFSAVLSAMRARQLKIPLSGDVYGRTVLELAAGSGSRETFMAVLAALEEELTEDQVKEMVVKRDKANTTVLMAATKSGSGDTFVAALDAAKKHAMGELISWKDDRGDTLLSAAVKWKNLGFLESVLERVRDGLGPPQVQGMLMADDGFDQSLLVLAAKSGNIGFFGEMVSFMANLLTSEQVHEFLVAKSSLGTSLLERVSRVGDKEFNKLTEACLAAALLSKQVHGGTAEQSSAAAFTPPQTGSLFWREAYTGPSTSLYRSFSNQVPDEEEDWVNEEDKDAVKDGKRKVKEGTAEQGGGSSSNVMTPHMGSSAWQEESTRHLTSTFEPFPKQTAAVEKAARTQRLLAARALGSVPGGAHTLRQAARTHGAKDDLKDLARKAHARTARQAKDYTGAIRPPQVESVFDRWVGRASIPPQCGSAFGQVAGLMHHGSRHGGEDTFKDSKGKADRVEEEWRKEEGDAGKRKKRKDGPVEEDLREGEYKKAVKREKRKVNSLEEEESQDRGKDAAQDVKGTVTGAEEQGRQPREQNPIEDVERKVPDVEGEGSQHEGEDSAKSWSGKACPPAPIVLASRVDPGPSVHESKEHGFRLTVRAGSLHRAIGPITIQDFAQVVQCEDDGQYYLAKTVVDCQPPGIQFPDVPLLMDFMVEDAPSDNISETFQVLACKGAGGWRKVRSKERVDQWGEYMRAPVSHFCRFKLGRKIHPGDPVRLERCAHGVIEVQNATDVELYFVLVPVSIKSEQTSHVSYTGNISFGAVGVTLGAGGGSDRESTVKRHMLPAGFTPDDMSVAAGGTFHFLPPPGATQGKLLVATISEEVHAGLPVKVVVLHGKFNTPEGRRRVILPICLQSKSRVYARLGPDDTPVKMVMIMASLGSGTTSATLPPTPDNTVHMAVSPSMATAAPLSTV